MLSTPQHTVSSQSRSTSRDTGCCPLHLINQHVDLPSFSAISPLTVTSLTALAKFTLVWRARLQVVVLLLDRNASPLVEPVCDSFDIRVLVEGQVAESVAGPAALIEYEGVVSISGISPNHYGHLLTAPAVRGAAIVTALEGAHHVGRVFVLCVFVGSLFVEPRRGDCVTNCVRDVLMERWKREEGSRLSRLSCLTLASGMLLGHFRYIVRIVDFSRGCVAS